MKSKGEPLLIFNSHGILSFIASSAYEISKLSKLRADCVRNVCKGNLIATGDYYFRFFNDNVEIEVSDIGQLSLERYDQICGVSRPRIQTTTKNKKYKRKTQTKKNNGKAND